jgi:hypothetical protein
MVAQNNLLRSFMDIKTILFVFLLVTAGAHLMCALGVLFFYMKTPPKNPPSIVLRFIITLFTGFLGLVYFIFIKRDQVGLPLDEAKLSDEKN